MMNMQKMMRQVQKMQSDMAKVQKELAEMKVEGTAGGGVVTVEITGHQEITSIIIDPEVVDPEDVDMLEDLITAATNDAIRKAKEMAENEMQKVTGGLNIPGMPGLPGM